jgi:hypothetical protein
MNLYELIERLEEIREAYNGDNPEILLATQPNYPLAFRLDNVVAYIDGMEAEHNGEKVVWLTEGVSIYDAPYAPRAVFYE